MTSDFITKCLGEANRKNVREKHPKKKEQHMQRLQGKLTSAYMRLWKKAGVENVGGDVYMTLQGISRSW